MNIKQKYIFRSVILAVVGNFLSGNIAYAENSPGWSGSGELGFASAHGNSSTETLNAKLNGEYEEGNWRHTFNGFGLRSRASFNDTDENGNSKSRRRTTANRYSLSAGSALRLQEHQQLTSAARYESDKFASYDWQSSISVGYGTRIMDHEKIRLDTQIGPGYRRAHNVEKQEVEAGVIGRGFLDFRYELTNNTELSNVLLVESNKYNTFAQNDFGVTVAMNSKLALKAGWQARYNSDVSDDRRKTDTLTTLNIVYKFK